jgi:radical SAM superfamily enzyme YgiQ (UPF0313 family)
MTARLALRAELEQGIRIVDYYEEFGGGVTTSAVARITVGLVQQGIWNMPLESMPLASAYLKATALADPAIREQVDFRIHNFRGGVTNAAMADAIFGKDLPDVLAFSVLGWNYRSFGELAATFKQLNPDGWVVFGGTHVSEQAARVFRMFPDVDVVVNGEGELTFAELLRRRLDDSSVRSLGTVAGISYRTRDNEVVTNPARPRIDDLGLIPSPFLTGALELTDSDGNFRYDVALMETNRGCPYKCAFCYWGGAVGQKIRAFPMDRLRAELDLFGRLKVHTIVACDANFGLLKQDIEFVRAMIETRDRYGFPQALETSWAKNKSTTFYTIVKMLKEAGMRSSFTLALQTLSEGALDSMNRRNMKVNEWEDLVEWLSEEGLDCYAELIWGSPGDTVADFMEGYDRLSRKVSRIAIYPLLLLPNTDYMERKEELGIKSVRGDQDDFEYVLAHKTMSFADNQEMQRFVFWARVVAENAVLRYSWVPLRHFAGLSQSQVLRNLDAWVDSTGDPAAAPLRESLASALGGTGSYGGAIRYFFTEPAAKELLHRWWRESIRPLVPKAHLRLLDEVFRYDLLTQPIYCPDGIIKERDLELRPVHGRLRYVRRGVRLDYDVPAIVAALRADRPVDATPSEGIVDLYYLAGAESAVTSTNHEIVMHFMGQMLEELVPAPVAQPVAASLAV